MVIKPDIAGNFDLIAGAYADDPLADGIVPVGIIGWRVFSVRLPVGFRLCDGVLGVVRLDVSEAVMRHVFSK